MESTTPDKLDTEKMYEGVIQIFERMHKRFIEYEKKDDTSDNTLDYLIKLAGSLGYTAQVHAGLSKSYQHEKRLADIEKKLGKIPPELLKELVKPGH